MQLFSKKIIPFFVSIALINFCFAQKSDSIKNISHLSGSLAVTNNGISIVPSFSLGKPALAINLSAGKKRLSFEPELDFALNGKPWQFLFWWRYKLVNTKKIKVGLGTHPAISFREDSILMNGVAKQALIASRFWAAELSPNYMVTNRISVGIYYLYSHGLQKQGLKNGHFLSVNSNISDIRIANRILLQIVPQFYYLKLDTEDGFYFTSYSALRKKDFPFSISAVINKKISSNIAGSKDFLWNVSLVYSFNKKYAAQ